MEERKGGLKILGIKIKILEKMGFGKNIRCSKPLSYVG